MKSSVRNALLTVSVLATISALACTKPAPSTKKPAAKTEVVTNVRTIIATKAVFSRELAVVGTTMASRDVVVSAKVMGKIISMNVNEGKTVNNGEVLFRIDDSDYRLNFTNALATKEQAAIGLKQAQIQLDGIKTDYDRMETLFKSNTIPAQQFEKIKMGYDQAKVGVDMAMSNFNRANIGIELARSQLANTTVVAPFGGVVTMKMSDVGSLASPGVPVLKLQGGVVYAMVNVPEVEMPNIRIGDKVGLKIDSAGDKLIDARVSSITNSIDPQTRTFRIRVDITSKGTKVYPGSYVKGTISLKGANTLSVPRYAISFDERGGKYVFVVKDGRAYKTTIVTGGKRGDLLEVLSGLAENDQVVTTGTDKLSNGAAVKIIK